MSCMSTSWLCWLSRRLSRHLNWSFSCSLISRDSFVRIMAGFNCVFVEWNNMSGDSFLNLEINLTWEDPPHLCWVVYHPIPGLYNTLQHGVTLSLHSNTSVSLDHAILFYYILLQTVSLHYEGSDSQHFTTIYYCARWFKLTAHCFTTA